MKRLVALAAAALALATPASAYAARPLAVDAQSYLVVNGKTGEVLASAPLSTEADVRQAVDAALHALPA